MVGGGEGSAPETGEGGAGQGAPPLVTYAIRLYNNAAFIEAALESAFAQSYHPLEILVADDGSSDGGYAIAERVLGAYRGPHRVQLYRNERNLGPGGQFTRIAERMSGSILVIADADDLSLPSRTQRLAERFQREGPSLMGLVCHFDPIDPEGRPLEEVAGTVGTTRPVAEAWTAAQLARGWDGPPGAVAAYRRAVLDLGPLDNAWQSEDLILGLRALLLGRMATLPEILVHRRVHLDNVSGPIRPSWTGRELARWYSRHLGRRLAATAVMRRDLERIAASTALAPERAASLRAAIADHARELKLLIVAPRLGPFGGWCVLPRLARLGIARKQALRALLQRLAPGLAMVLLRRNPVYRARAAMER
jgi:glycosyltransferase involved in cell wall biosynthesis